MNYDNAKKIVDYLQSKGYDAKLREDYAARGSFGQRTAGILVPNNVKSYLMVGVAAGALNIDELPTCEDDMMFSKILY
jgi:hypothetical protein